MARPPLRTVCFIAAIALCGCGRTLTFEHSTGSSTTQPQAPATARRDLNFTGLWLVDQPTHALYEATYYELKVDGTLDQGNSIGLDGHLQEHGETGSVAKTSGEPSCVFGETWWNTDAFTLVILGQCSDDRFREIALTFERSPGLGVDLGAPTKIVVGGESGWEHDNWPWRFLLCNAGETEATCK